jgi:hypothetical protein
VQPIGRELKRRQLEEKLERLENERKAPPANDGLELSHSEAIEDDDAYALEISQDDDTTTFVPETSQPVDVSKSSRRILPDATANNLYARWEEVLPRLLDPFLSYLSCSTGRAIEPVSDIQSTCLSTTCGQKNYMVLCLYQDRECVRPYLLHS